MTKKKFKHCHCGKRLKYTDVEECSICLELRRIKKENSELQRTKNQCQIKNRELMVQVKSFEEDKNASKTKWPFWLKIEQYETYLTESYLSKFLEVATAFPSMLQLSYGKR